MTFPLWLTGMACLLMVAMMPVHRNDASGYPVIMSAIVGLGLVIGALLFPETGGPWLAGLLTLGAVGVSPILADGLMDDATPVETASAGDGSDSGVDGAMMAAGLAATTATMGVTT